jgi:hypothetical protein
MVVDEPLKLSPHFKRTRFPPVKDAVAVDIVDVVNWVAPDGHPVPTALLNAQIVAVPGKPFAPAASNAVTDRLQLAVLVPSNATAWTLNVVPEPSGTINRWAPTIPVDVFLELPPGFDPYSHVAPLPETALLSPYVHAKLTS